MQGNNKMPRVLIGNIFFAPMPFGGATIVTEHMGRLLKEKHGWDVIVLTSIQDPDMIDYSIRRYSVHGLDVIAVKLPHIHPHSRTNWDNPDFNRVLETVLHRFQPDVVHWHSIQNFGATALDTVRRAGIPMALTVHDCWFLCERQFMINHAGAYCHQWSIDPKVCRFCLPDAKASAIRNEQLLGLLNQCELILFPSDFHRRLHLANGVDPSRSQVNKNGVKLPGPLFQRLPNPDPERHRLRFGFVGGPGPIKGASIFAKAMAGMSRKDYEVRVVDAAGNAGQSWRHDPVWKQIPGDVTFVPPYDQDTIDDVFSQMDVLLFPSQWKESFGLTVREAMVRDTWVVATDAGGLSEDCIDGENATVIPMDGNVETMRSVLSGLLDNPPPEKIKSGHIQSVAGQAEELDSYLRTLLPA